MRDPESGDEAEDSSSGAEADPGSVNSAESVGPDEKSEGSDAEPASSDEESDTEDEEPGALETYRSLPRKQRRTVALICLFVSLHVGTVLVKGLKPELRNFLWPAFGWYGDGLRMATTWGMFGAEHTNASVYSVGVDADGRRHAIFPRPLGEASALSRLHDIRLRKVQSNLKKEKDHKSWGSAYARYWCNHPPRGLRFKQVLVETAEDFDEEKFPRTAVVTVNCGKKEGTP